jgi:tRNA G10  N-methylase Trm11
VRLGSELFGRAAHLSPVAGKLTVWDPACGSGQLIASVGLGNRQRIARLVASDIDAEVLPLAARNLSLLTTDGLIARRNETADLVDAYGKESHRSALASADRMVAAAEPFSDLDVGVERADLLDRTSLGDAVRGIDVDLVLTDLPYGSQTHLTGADDAQEVFETILENLIGVLPARAILVLVMAGRRLPRTSRRPLSTVRVGSRVAGFFAADSS